MPIKNQQECYRNFGGKRYTNYSDLIQSEEEQAAIIAEAKRLYNSTRKILHPDGYYQLFVSGKKLYQAKLIGIGRSKVNRTVYFNKTTELHKEIKKHLASPNWGLEETGTPDMFEVTSGFRTVGTVIVTQVDPLK